MASEPTWYLWMLLRSCRYSGLPAASNSARMRTMKSWPTFSSSERECSVLSAQRSPSVRRCGVGAGSGGGSGDTAGDRPRVRATEPSSVNNTNRGRGFRDIEHENTAEVVRNHPQIWKRFPIERPCTVKQGPFGKGGLGGRGGKRGGWFGG